VGGGWKGAVCEDMKREGRGCGGSGDGSKRRLSECVRESSVRLKGYEMFTWGKGAGVNKQDILIM
jgi:hypothetical protein